MASINVMEERASHALRCPEDREFEDVYLFAPSVTGRGTVHGHLWVTGALPALSMCQAGRRAVGCAGKGGSGPEYQLNAGRALAPELSGGQTDLQASVHQVRVCPWILYVHIKS